MRRASLVAPAAIVACALAACGGTSTGQGASSPTDAVKTYLNSVANGDGAAACAVVSQSLQSRELSAARSSGIKAASCADLFSQVRVHLTAAQRKQLQDATVSSSSQSGNTATVTLKGASNPLTLQKVGGKWIITAGIGG
jgi:hypothetical protein